MKVNRLINNISCILLAIVLGLFSGILFIHSRKKVDTTFLDTLDGKILCRDGSVPSKKDLNKDYFFIFYGADWCMYCKNSHEDILSFYNEYKEKYNNFTFILAGTIRDTSNDDLLVYLNNEDYDFYYINYDLRDEAGLFELPAYKECERFFVPSFILIDRSGNVLSNSNGPTEDDYSEYRPFEFYKGMMASKR